MSKTMDNLKEAFAGESQARNKYTYWAGIARKEKYYYIAKIFEETAENEKRHAKDEFQLTGGLNDTAANLKAAMEGSDAEAIRKRAEELTQASHKLAEAMYQRASAAGAGRQTGPTQGGGGRDGATADEDVVDAEYEEAS